MAQPPAPLDQPVAPARAVVPAEPGGRGAAVTLALPAHGPLLRQSRWGRPMRVPLIFSASFLGGWLLSLLDRGFSGGVPVIDSFAVVLGGAALATVVASELYNSRYSRAFARASRRASLRDALPGERVRVRGVVEAGGSVQGVGSRANAVLALYCGRIASFSGLFARLNRPVMELRGRDFRIALTSGERVTVKVWHAVFVPQSRIAAQGASGRKPLWTRLEEDESGHRVVLVYLEELIRPGDRVEVVGLAESGVDPDGDALGYRGPRMGTTLRGTRARPLLIRRA
jgi:hypothetical protein